MLLTIAIICGIVGLLLLAAVGILTALGTSGQHHSSRYGRGNEWKDWSQF